MSQITRIDNFFYIERFVWNLYLEKKFNSSDLAVYTTLCSMANQKTNECFPTTRKIIEISQKSENTVCRSIKKLCELHLIIKTERTKEGENISNLYHIVNYEEYVDKKHTSPVIGDTPPQPLAPPLPKIGGTNNNNITISLSKDNDYGVFDSQKTPSINSLTSDLEEKTNHSAYNREVAVEETEEKSTFQEIQDYWNSKEIIVHNKLSLLVEKYTRKLFKEKITVEDIKKSIDNYEEILHDSRTLMKYKWNLHEFLQRESGCRAYIEKTLEDCITKQ